MGRVVVLFCGAGRSDYRLDCSAAFGASESTLGAGATLSSEVSVCAGVGLGV